MSRRLDLADEAVEDLDAVRRWYSQAGAGVVAGRRVRQIVAAIGRLRRNPCLHRRGSFPDTRELPVQGHRVVYRVTPDTNDNRTAGDVLVLRIFGPGQARDRR